MARKPSRQAMNALDDAQQVIYDAWEASGARRLKLAQKALDISPLCADAHVILAYAAPDAGTALPIWRAAVAAGEASLGPAGFAEMEGEFWGWLETRPYMRAVAGLATTLRDLGQGDEAIALGQRMLVLNPNDNQGIRYEVLGWLLADGRDADAAALIATYPDEGMAGWPWARALLAFRKAGADAAAGEALRIAMEENPHVAPLLTGRKRMPKREAPFYSPGDPSEAQMIVQQLGPAWVATPGAVAWVDAALPLRAARRAAPKQGDDGRP